jgi:hypothetical protein
LGTISQITRLSSPTCVSIRPDMFRETPFLIFMRPTSPPNPNPTGQVLTATSLPLFPQRTIPSADMPRKTCTMPGCSRKVQFVKETKRLCNQVGKSYRPLCQSHTKTLLVRQKGVALARTPNTGVTAASTPPTSARQTAVALTRSPDTRVTASCTPPTSARQTAVALPRCSDTRVTATSTPPTSATKTAVILPRRTDTRVAATSTPVRR